MKKLLLVAQLFLSTSAVACGVGLHMFMADLAVNMLNATDLADLLKANARAYRNGVTYPDSGYPINHEVGEFNHWEKFLNQYLKHIRTSCSLPFEGECAMLFAHLMGCMAHSAGDVNWDKVFLPQIAAIQFDNSVDRAQEIDGKFDFLAVIDFNRSDVVQLKYVPTELFETLYRECGQSYTKADIEAGTNLVHFALMGEIFAAPSVYHIYKASLPWSADHYYTAPGGVLDGAHQIVKLWEKVWQRLKAGQKITFAATGGWPNIDFGIKEN